MNRANRIIRSRYVKYWIEKNKNDIEIFLFPNKPTSPWKYDIPTMVIPHDIQIFLAHEVPGIYYTERGYKKGTEDIIRDFKNRDHIVAISDYDRTEMIRFMPWAEHKIKRIYDPICFDKMEMCIRDRTHPQSAALFPPGSYHLLKYSRKMCIRDSNVIAAKIQN